METGQLAVKNRFRNSVFDMGRERLLGYVEYDNGMLVDEIFCVVSGGKN